MLNGDTAIIAHIGHPTTTFKSSMIYNPWFEAHRIDAAVVPMGVTAERFAAAFPEIVRFSNFAGALITMPHKVTVVGLLDEVSPAVKIAGACNAVRWRDGKLIGDMFDGEGFVRGVTRNGGAIRGRRVLIVGAGGVGSAIAASAAAAGAAALGLHDVNAAAAQRLAERLAQHYPSLRLAVGGVDPRGFDVIVNATPLGMSAGDPLPLDVSLLSPASYVAEVVLNRETTPFLAAAKALGCRTQVGLDMLFEQVPAYLEFFGFPVADAGELRAGARIVY